MLSKLRLKPGWNLLRSRAGSQAEQSPLMDNAEREDRLLPALASLPDDVLLEIATWLEDQRPVHTTHWALTVSLLYPASFMRVTLTNDL
jgi:hypothetical protein